MGGFARRESRPVKASSRRSLNAGHNKKRLSPLFIMPEKGLEPPPNCLEWILNPPRLPFRHSGLVSSPETDFGNRRDIREGHEKISTGLNYQNP